MRRLLALLILLASIAGSATAQERVHRIEEPGLAEPATAEPAPQGRVLGDGMQVIHVSDELSRQPEAVEALRAFHEAKAAGALPARKTVASYRIGEAKDFKVLKNLRTTTEWATKNFTLKAQSPEAYIWVATDELSQTYLSEAALQELINALIARTPAGSFRADKGIIANDNHLFGQPPNVDGDGRVDVLLFNIEEGNDDCCILGFVTSADLWGTTGNRADILYLDTKPSMERQGPQQLASTAAHEYQHLINFNYQDRTNLEKTFVNEGLSEWASAINGYFDRGISYLARRDEHNTPLFEWRGQQAINVLVNDYQRALLFTTYLAQRIGPEATGSIARASRPSPTGGTTYLIGAQGYETVLQRQAQPLTLAEVVADFHTANFLNSRVVDERYGYEVAQRQGLRTGPTRVFEGTSMSQTALTNLTIKTGAVQFFTWKDVANFRFRARFDPTLHPVLLDGLRTRLVLRAILERFDGGIEVRDFQADQMEEHHLPGEYKQVTLAVINTNAEDGDVYALDLLANWGASGFTTSTTAYETGQAVSGKFFTLSAGATGEMATRFALPASPRTTLASVQVAPYFLSQFSNGNQPQDAPRDLNLKIWASDRGKPGAELFSLHVKDPRAYEAATLGLAFFEVNLAPYEAQLASLPDTIFVGYTDAGTDGNALVAGVAAYAEQNLSFVRGVGTGSWRALWDVQFQGGAEGEYPLRGTVVPVRATFKLASQPVAVEDEPVLPEAIELHQNYPNPFNPATTVSYTLPAATHVRLAVYDVLGRRVALLADEVQPAGLHEARVDGRDWTSGIYFYVLEASGRKQTRKMVLVK